MIANLAYICMHSSSDLKSDSYYWRSKSFMSAFCFLLIGETVYIIAYSSCIVLILGIVLLTLLKIR